MFSLSPLVINKNFAQTFGLINAVTLNILIQEMEYKNLNTYEDYINMTLTQLCKFTYLDEKLQKCSLEQLQQEGIINCIHNNLSQTYSIKINEENIIKKLNYDTLITDYYKDELSKDTKLTSLDKDILFTIIENSRDSLCVLSNKQLSQKCTCSESAITKSINKLCNLNYIEIVKFDGGTRYVKTNFVSSSINNEGITRDDVSTGYVYIFKCDKYYKIGLTKDVTRRLNQLNIITPIPIECVYTSKCITNPRTLEKNLHALFCQNNVQGEWFNLSVEELTTAKNVVEEYEKKNKVN